MTGGKTNSTLQRMYRVTLGDGGKATKLHGLWYSFSWHFHRGVAASERPLANLQNRLSTRRLHSMFPILLYQRALQYWGSSQKKSVINSQVLNLTVRSIFLFKQAFQIFSIFFNLGSIKMTLNTTRNSTKCSTKSQTERQPDFWNQLVRGPPRRIESDFAASTKLGVKIMRPNSEQQVFSYLQ